MPFQRLKQHISASDVLQALADAEDIQLDQCLITGVLDINRLFDPAEKFRTEKLNVEENQQQKKLTLTQSIVFDKCTFEENVIFTGPVTEPDSVAVEFQKNVLFSSSHFKSQVRFRNAVFHGIASFDGCSFDSFATFKGICVEGSAKFRTVIFKGYGLFTNTVFKASTRFTNSHFVKGVNFAQAKFFSDTDFNGVYSSSRATPICDDIWFAKKHRGDDESFWRFVKQSAQEAGYYQLAGEFFYNERCARLRQKSLGMNYDSLSATKKFGRLIFAVRLLPEFLLGKLLFGYGEKPIRVLVVSAVIIVACAFYYAEPGALIYRDGVTNYSFLQGLYFSITTFTTLGYGDLYPAKEGFCRLIAMAQAATGGCMIALFVVCLAKRFSRG